MTRMTRMISARLVVSLVVLAFVQMGNVSQASAQGFRSSRPVEGVYKDRITPHWLAGNTRFWYRNDLAGKTEEFILVDAEHGTREPAFDHTRLAAALSQAAGAEYKADRLPFDTIELADDGKIVRFTVEGTTWACDLGSYVCTRTDLGPIQAPAGQGEGTSRFGRRGQGSGRGRGPSMDSPDGKWTAFVKDNNAWVRSKDSGQEVQLSTDGAEDNAYGMLSWAPGTGEACLAPTLVAWRIEPGDGKEVYLIESSPKEGGRAKFSKRPYALPGDKFKTYELNLFDIETRKQTKPQVDKLALDWEVPRLHWKKDGRHFAYETVDRGHQRFRVVEVDSHTGQARNLIDEKSKTFIWTAHMENLDLRLVNWLDKSDEILYVSERDGWRHLYLIDAAKGEVRNQITKGEWVVRGIDLIDEEARQVWFHACGKNANEDPYFIHYYRVNFDGSGLVALTEGNGTHSIQYSPDKRYLIDTYSRVDMAPIHNLRRVSDGKLVCPLEKADIRELIAGGWTPPEVFVAKGRDGRTDIWGIIARPKDFDPNKKYPVIEYIYAGPQGSYVPKRFSPYRQFASLADLGFIVVQMDGMGTANRSKAFHDVCWKNLKDAGFPDRILWHQAVARKYPYYYDISRVGIYGNSAGGQSAAGAVLFHPEFYQAAVASCGCHDNRMDKASWNEQWMGYPVGPCYSECSNIDNAARLRGKLFLIVGEMDNNVPPESTMRFVDALVKADKDFDLLVIPGAGHGMGGAYGQHRMQDFFVRNLLGTEPPNRNAANKG
jgi:dipeptidyl aminopeptidase/acylaminoacyl peptidase